MSSASDRIPAPPHMWLGPEALLLKSQTADKVKSAV